MQRRISLISLVLFAAVICLFAVNSPCQNFKYEAMAKRDPFVPLVGVERTKVSGLEDVVSVDDVKFEGITIGPGGKKTVFMNDRILKEGDRVGLVEIIKIGDESVTLVISGTEHNVELNKEGGPRSGL